MQWKQPGPSCHGARSAPLRERWVWDRAIPSESERIRRGHGNGQGAGRTWLVEKGWESWDHPAWRKSSGILGILNGILEE